MKKAVPSRMLESTLQVNVEERFLVDRSIVGGCQHLPLLDARTSN